MAKQLVTKKKVKMFLLALAQTGNAKEASEAAGYADPTYLRKLRSKDPKFKVAWEEALVAAAEDILIPEATRRAVEGVREPVYHKGEIAGFKMKYSDQLLMFLLKGSLPDTYGNHVKLDGKLEGNFGIAAIPMVVSPEEWELEAFKVHQDQKTVDLEPGEFSEEASGELVMA